MVQEGELDRLIRGRHPHSGEDIAVASEGAADHDRANRPLHGQARVGGQEAGSRRHPGDVEALKELMGHRSIATTQVYLRKLDRQRAMERVRDLSWVLP